MDAAFSVQVRLHTTFTYSADQFYQRVAQLSQRDRAAGWVSYGQKWKTGTGRQYLRTIKVYIEQLRRFGQQRNRNRRKNAK